MADIADRRLIINADDLGLSPGVNRGILEAHAAGTVTSASLLANAPGLSDAVRRLHEAATLQVGLHYNLTVGSPVLRPERVASLCNSRTREFHSLQSLVWRALAGRIDPDQVAAECRAQLDVLRARGVTVRHIDSHRHVHVLPGVWQPVMAVARGAGVQVRLPREPLGGHNRFGRGLIVGSLRVACRVAANGNGREPIRADHFRGLGLLGAVDFHHRLLVLLDQLEVGVTELMVHPGYVDRDLAAWDSYTGGRERELAALCSSEVRNRLRRGNVQLVA